jgi:hypothetical protein
MIAEQAAPATPPLVRDGIILPHPTAVAAAIEALRRLAGDRCDLSHDRDIKVCSQDGTDGVSFACGACTARRLANALEAEASELRAQVERLQAVAVGKKYPAEIRALAAALVALVAHGAAVVEESA